MEFVTFWNVKLIQKARDSVTRLLQSDIQHITIHTFSRCETDRFRLWNGPFQSAKWTVSEAKMIGIEML